MRRQIRLAQQALAKAPGVPVLDQRHRVAEPLTAQSAENQAIIPNDESIIKLMSLATQNIARKWTMPIQNRSAVLNVFSITFDGRVPI